MSDNISKSNEFVKLTRDEQDENYFLNDNQPRRLYGNTQPFLREVSSQTDDDTIQNENNQRRRWLKEVTRAAISPEQRNNPSICVDISYINALERISSRLIQLLSAARMRPKRVNNLSGSSEQNQRLQKLNPVFGAKTRILSAHEEGLYSPDSNVSNDTDIPESDDYLQAEEDEDDDIPVGTSSSSYNAALSLQNGQTSNTCKPEGSRFMREVNMEHVDSYKGRDQTVEKRKFPFVAGNKGQLGHLLPEEKRAFCKRKSPIAKESIFYMKRLKMQDDLMNQLEEKINQRKLVILKLASRIKRLEELVSVNRNGHFAPNLTQI